MMCSIDVAICGEESGPEKSKRDAYEALALNPRTRILIKESVMKRNVKALVLAVLLFGVQGFVSGNALAYNSPDKVFVKAEIVEDTAFPRSALDD